MTIGCSYDHLSQ